MVTITFNIICWNNNFFSCHLAFNNCIFRLLDLGICKGQGKKVFDHILCCGKRRLPRKIKKGNGDIIKQGFISGLQTRLFISVGRFINREMRWNGIALLLDYLVDPLHNSTIPDEMERKVLVIISKVAAWFIINFEAPVLLIVR